LNSRTKRNEKNKKEVCACTPGGVVVFSMQLEGLGRSHSEQGLRREEGLCLSEARPPGRRGVCGRLTACMYVCTAYVCMYMCVCVSMRVCLFMCLFCTNAGVCKQASKQADLGCTRVCSAVSQHHDIASRIAEQCG
jgi:hypothetical protein